MSEISFEDWKKIEMKVGRVVSVERVPRTEKLYKLQVDVGEAAPRQIVTSLVPHYSEDELLNCKIIVLVNLKPTKFAGEVSQGMLICAEKEDGSACVLLAPQKDIDVGTRVT